MSLDICIHLGDRNFSQEDPWVILISRDLVGLCEHQELFITIHESKHDLLEIIIDYGISYLKGFLEEAIWFIL